MNLENFLQFSPKLFADPRGYFFEAFNQKEFDAFVGHHVEFVQDNQSRSSRGVLRGLHFQLPPFVQGKLVRVTSGVVFDVIVDIRRSSPTFLSWHGFELTSENHVQLWVPPGFAHGFLALSDHADVHYKATSYYDPLSDRSIRWDDPNIGVNWPLEGQPTLSEKDKMAPLSSEAELFD